MIHTSVGLPVLIRSMLLAFQMDSFGCYWRALRLGDAATEQGTDAHQ